MLRHATTDQSKKGWDIGDERSRRGDFLRRVVAMKAPDALPCHAEWFYQPCGEEAELRAAHGHGCVEFLPGVPVRVRVVQALKAEAIRESGKRYNPNVPVKTQSNSFQASCGQPRRCRGLYSAMPTEKFGGMSVRRLLPGSTKFRPVSRFSDRFGAREHPRWLMRY